MERRTLFMVDYLEKVKDHRCTDLGFNGTVDAAYSPVRRIPVRRAPSDGGRSRTTPHTNHNQSPNYDRHSVHPYRPKPIYSSQALGQMLVHLVH
jgi:hypothetical protein